MAAPVAAEVAAAGLLAGARAALGAVLGVAGPSAGGGGLRLQGGLEGSAWAAGLPGAGLRGAREGARLLRWGLEPYASGRCRAPPLVVAALAPFVEAGPVPAPALALLSAAVDALSALALLRAGRALGLRGGRAWVAPAAHLLSPLSAAAAWAGATSALENCCLFWALSAALAGSPAGAALPAALAAYLGVHPLLLVLPLGLLLRCGPRAPGAAHAGCRGAAAKFAALLAVWLGALLWLSSALSRGWLAAAGGPTGAGLPSLTDGLRHWTACSYIAWYRLDDLSPNLGLFWYFFSEVMGPFRRYFLALMHLQPFLLLPPLALALRERPMLFLFGVSVSQSLLRPYPGAGDAAQFMALAPLVPEFALVPAVTRFAVASVFAYVYALGPLFHTLWVEAGVANANFFYSISLVSAAGHVAALAAALAAGGAAGGAAPKAKQS